MVVALTLQRYAAPDKSPGPHLTLLPVDQCSAKARISRVRISVICVLGEPTMLRTPMVFVPFQTHQDAASVPLWPPHVIEPPAAPGTATWDGTSTLPVSGVAMKRTSDVYCDAS